MLARAPEGVRADQVAARLNKSVSTAYNLLNSLCDEHVAVRGPGGVYRIAPEFRYAIASEGASEDFTGIVDDLLARTHKRAYAAVVRDGVLRIVMEKGLQGMPRLPGMDPEIRDNAHALALGKIVLAHSPPEAIDRYIANGLRPFTPNTITSADELRTELRQIRRTGVAVEREEFDGDFCCLSAAILDDRRRFVGAVGISMSRRAFNDEHTALAETLRDVAGFQASADARTVLEPEMDPRLASAGSHERGYRP
jgi:DNA-binding IclR family transcriptional regulator